MDSDSEQDVVETTPESDRTTAKIRCYFPGLSINQNWSYGQKRVWVSKEMKEFKSKIVKACAGQPKVDGMVVVTYTLYVNDFKPRDCDNYLKPVLDSTKNLLYGDDSLIYELHGHKVVVADPEDIGFELVVQKMSPDGIKKHVFKRQKATRATRPKLKPSRKVVNAVAAIMQAAKGGDANAKRLVKTLIAKRKTQ